MAQGSRLWQWRRYSRLALNLLPGMKAVRPLFSEDCYSLGMIQSCRLCPDLGAPCCYRGRLLLVYGVPIRGEPNAVSALLPAFLSACAPLHLASCSSHPTLPRSQVRSRHLMLFPGRFCRPWISRNPTNSGPWPSQSCHFENLREHRIDFVADICDPRANMLK